MLAGGGGESCRARRPGRCTFARRDDKVRLLASATYDEATNTVRLRPRRPLVAGNFFHLTVEGDSGLTTPAGEPLDGDGDALPGGDFHRVFGRGQRLAYFDANGDRVVLRLARGGILELTRDLSGEGLDLVLLDTKPGKSVLTGTVRKPNRRTGDALTTLRSITGLEGVTNRLTEPPFIIGDR